MDALFSPPIPQQAVDWAIVAVLIVLWLICFWLLTRKDPAAEILRWSTRARRAWLWVWYGPHGD